MHVGLPNQADRVANAPRGEIRLDGPDSLDERTFASDVAPWLEAYINELWPDGLQDFTLLQIISSLREEYSGGKREDPGAAFINVFTRVVRGDHPQIEQWDDQIGGGIVKMLVRHMEYLNDTYLLPAGHELWVEREMYNNISARPLSGQVEIVKLTRVVAGQPRAVTFRRYFPLGVSPDDPSKDYFGFEWCENKGALPNLKLIPTRFEVSRLVHRDSSDDTPSDQRLIVWQS